MNPDEDADLLLARRGTAYFARRLAALADAAMRGPSRQAGWTRAHLIAHVGYHARAMAGLVASARAGERQPACPAHAARLAEIELGATLPPRGLRSLVQHAAIHLDVEWRDLKDAAWDASLSLPDGTSLAVRATPRMRAMVVWQAALDLDNGGRIEDIPAELRPEVSAEMIGARPACNG